MISAPAPQPGTVQSREVQSVKPTAVSPSTVHIRVLEKDKTVPLTTIMKAMTKAMVKANAVPHFGYCDEVR